MGKMAMLDRQVVSQGRYEKLSNFTLTKEWDMGKMAMLDRQVVSQGRYEKLSNLTLQYQREV